VNRTQLLLWTDSTAAYLDAIKAAGLSDRVAVETLPRKEKPSAEQLARTEALMAYDVPPGLLASMPKLSTALSHACSLSCRNRRHASQRSGLNQ
jgi:hypothetical protein